MSEYAPGDCGKNAGLDIFCRDLRHPSVAVDVSMGVRKVERREDPSKMDSGLRTLLLLCWGDQLLGSSNSRDSGVPKSPPIRGGVKMVAGEDVKFPSPHT